MTQSNETTIEQMNETIARFMGGIKQIIPEGGLHGYKEGTVLWMCLFSDNADSVRLLEYHISWDWLKPVIDKISEYILVYPEQVKLIIEMKVVVNIQAAHERVYLFCKWLNQQK